MILVLRISLFGLGVIYFFGIFWFRKGGNLILFNKIFREDCRRIFEESVFFYMKRLLGRIVCFFFLGSCFIFRIIVFIKLEGDIVKGRRKRWKIVEFLVELNNY